MGGMMRRIGRVKRPIRRAWRVTDAVESRGLEIWLGQYTTPHTGSLIRRVYLELRPAGIVLGLRVEDVDEVQSPVWARLSVNVVDETILPGEFIVSPEAGVEKKDLTWLLEREGDLEKLVPIFEDTGRTVSYGYVKDRPVWRLVDFEHRYPWLIHD